MFVEAQEQIVLLGLLLLSALSLSTTRKRLLLGWAFFPVKQLSLQDLEDIIHRLDTFESNFNVSSSSGSFFVEVKFDGGICDVGYGHGKGKEVIERMAGSLAFMAKDTRMKDAPE